MHLEHVGDVFALFELQEVDDVHPLGGTAAFRNLVAFQAVNPPEIGDEEDVVVGRADEEFFDKVFFLARDTRHAAAAALLGLVNVHRHALDVARMGGGNDAVFLRNEIFDVHFAADRLNIGAARIVEFALDFAQFFFDDLDHQLMIGQNGFQFADAFHQRLVFVLNLLLFESGQLPQTHCYDGGRLRFVEVDAVFAVVHQLHFADVHPAFGRFEAAFHQVFLGVCLVGGRADARIAHDDAAGREVRPFDEVHQFRQFGVGVIHQVIDRVDDFAQVVGRDVRRHADGDARRPVDQKVRVSRRQNHRFLAGIVKVRAKIHRFLFNVGEHFERDFAHARFGITVGSRRVAVHRTEVPVAVHQRIAHRKVLRQTHQRVINRHVAVRMIPAQHVADRGGALAVRLIRCEAVFVHRVQNAAMHRFQTVPHVRQRTADDDGHRIIQKCGAHFFFDVAGINGRILQIIQLKFHLSPGKLLTS